LAPWDYRSSNSVDPITYKTEEAEPAPAAAVPEKEEPKKLEAKGNATSFGGTGIDWNGDVNPMSLMAAYPPSFPKDEKGNVIGLTVPNINSIPHATKYGFQDGDIVSGVNGVRINTDNIASLMALVPQFKDAKNFNVTVIRNGQPVNINITP
jgi:S1-C subfamily serine protease